MAIKGIFTSHASLIGERTNDIASNLLKIGYLGTAPLTALSKGMPMVPAQQTSFSWIDDVHISGNQTATAAALAAATTIVVDDAGIWTANTVLLSEASGEYIFVTAIAADNKTLTVIRGLGGTTTAAIAINDTLQLVGKAFAEGSDKPEAVTQQGVEYSNYLQIVKSGWAITGTAKKIGYITGDKMAYNKQQCTAYHAEALEYMSLWGVKSMQAIGGKKLSTTNGIVTQIGQYGGNVVSAATGGVPGNLSMRDFLGWLRVCFDKKVMEGSNERIIFTSSQALEVINNAIVLDSTYQMAVKETEYGISINQIMGINFNVKIMTHPFMVENATWAKEMYLLHPGLLRRRKLRPETVMQEFLIANNTNAGLDADEGFLLDETGWEIRGAPAMGILRNIQTAVAS